MGVGVIGKGNERTSEVLEGALVIGRPFCQDHSEAEVRGGEVRIEAQRPLEALDGCRVVLIQIVGDAQNVEALEVVGSQLQIPR